LESDFFVSDLLELDSLFEELDSLFEEDPESLDELLDELELEDEPRASFL